MQHSTPLISMLVIGFGLAFVFATIAQRLRISQLVGYLLAGVAVGPFTPGFVADQPLANELAEIGVILLMFGVGLHFSLKDLMAVRTIALPGALLQIVAITTLGVGLATLLGWHLAGGLVFGLALSVASTVVALRSLQERQAMGSPAGQIAIGWLVVEDLITVIALVLLPALLHLLDNGGQSHGLTDLLFPVAMAVGKMIAFVVVMLVIGRRLIPWLLRYVAKTGSLELFRLSVLATALGVAYGAASLFGVSFALGAFFAGMILGESELSQQATKEVLPLRDAFAVLFFISVGMLFNPAILVQDPLPVLATLAIIIVGNGAVAFFLVRALGQNRTTAAMIAVGLAQIGEFSFILAGLGVSLQVLPERGRDLILAAALLSILLNPFLLRLADRLLRRSSAG